MRTRYIILRFCQETRLRLSSTLLGFHQLPHVMYKIIWKLFGKEGEKSCKEMCPYGIRKINYTLLHFKSLYDINVCKKQGHAK